MTQREYESREIAQALKQLQEFDKGPLQDRKDAAGAFASACAECPDLVAERAEWLLNGSYGYGQMILAKNAMQGRGNKPARLCNLIASFEWQCPARMVPKVWHSLTTMQQAALTQALVDVIAAYERGDND